MKLEGGTLEASELQALGDGWRLVLTVRRRDDRPLTLQASLVGKGEARSETWMYRIGEP